MRTLVYFFNIQIRLPDQMKAAQWYPYFQQSTPDTLIEQAGKLGVTLQHKLDYSEVLSLYDTFDWRLINSGRLLLYRNKALKLIDSNHFSELASDDCDRPKGDFQPQFIAPVAAELITKIVTPRVLFERFRFLLQLAIFEVRDDEHKQIGNLQLYRLAPMSDAAGFDGANTHQGLEQEVDYDTSEPLNQWIVPQPLRGYGKPLSSVSERLTNVPPLSCRHPIEQLLTKKSQQAAIDGYHNKPKLQFADNCSGRELLSNSLAVNFTIAQHNIDGISRDRDPEFLHDFRVSLRRMRAQLSLLKGIYSKSCSRQMRDILGIWGQATNSLRDLDVWLLESERYTSLLPPNLHPGLHELTQILVKRRRQEVRKVRNFLQSPELKQQQKTINSLIEAKEIYQLGKHHNLTAQYLAEKTFNQHCRHIAKLCAKAHQESADEEIHSIRIECKKLRYLTELFKPIANSEAWTAVTGSLKILQDELGHFNDLSVEQEFLNTHIAPLIARQQLSSTGVLATGALLALLNSEQLQEKQKILTNLYALAEQLQQPAAKNLFIIGLKKSKHREPDY